jgi:hypothetical protein
MEDLEPRQVLMQQILKVLEEYSDAELLMVVSELYKTNEEILFDKTDMESSDLIH